MGEFVPPVISARQHWFNRFTWKLLLGIALVDVVWIAALRWDVDWHNVGILACYVIPTILLALFFTHRYREPPFALMVQLVLQFMLIPYTIASLNYVTSTWGFPLQDKALVAIDQALGFNWVEYVTWVRQHDWLARAYTICYSAAWFEFLIVAVLLFLTGRLGRLQHITFIVIAGSALTSLIFALIPAMGAYWFFNIDPTQLPGTALPAAGLVHIPDLMALRNGQFHHIDLHFQGIVTFPSFHTTFGLMLIYGAWPFRWLRPIYILLNLLLIFSTPVDGGHYLIDAIGGIVMAGGLVLLVNKLLPLSACGALAQAREGDYTLSPP